MVIIVPQHLTKLLADENLRSRGERTRFDRHIVWIIQHGHEVPKERDHGNISCHMRFISRRPEGHRVLAQELCSLADGITEVCSKTDELVAVADVVGDEFLVYTQFTSG